MVLNKSFYLCRRVAEHLEEVLPNLDSMILTNNSLQELGDVDNLSTVKSLRTIWWALRP